MAGASEKTVPTGVRLPESMPDLLEAIRKKKGMASRNDAVVEALREYIERNNHLLSGRAA